MSMGWLPGMGGVDKKRRRWWKRTFVSWMDLFVCGTEIHLDILLLLLTFSHDIYSGVHGIGWSMLMAGWWRGSSVQFICNLYPVIIYQASLSRFVRLMMTVSEGDPSEWVIWMMIVSEAEPNYLANRMYTELLLLAIVPSILCLSIILGNYFVSLQRQ